jgi:DNA-binding NarL/FixJ family response regulator
MYSIIIVDDHAMVAEAIRSRVEAFSRCAVLADLRNGKELLNHLAQAKNIPDVVLLDVNMPIMDGHVTMKRLKSEHPTLRVLVLTMEDDEKTFLKMISAGANGLISKSAHAAELEKAIYQVMEKGNYYAAEMSDVLFQALRSDDEDAALQFSNSELELLKHIGKDLTYKEIADIMCVSPKTVDGYRNSLFQKLGVKSRVGLAMYAVREGYYKHADY